MKLGKSLGAHPTPRATHDATQSQCAGRAQCTIHATLRTVCMLQVRADALAAPEPLYVDAIFNFVLAGLSRTLRLPTDGEGCA